VSERGDWWRAKAELALASFLALENGNQDAFAYGLSTSASANLYGWQDSRTTYLLGKLRGKQKADGGYGLDVAYDAFQNGTVNPASTSYTVTMAGHVGEALLGAYQAGLVPREEVQSLVTKLVLAPKVTVSRGKCVAYSYNANDDDSCVHNVNAGVAWFLIQANAAGFSVTGLHGLITNISMHEMIAYREADKWWPYKDSGPNQDVAHESYSAASMYRMAYWVGREAVYRILANPFTESGTPIAHMMLISLPGGIGSQGQVDPETTLWCELGDLWRTEATTYLDGLTTPNSFAQFAFYASKNALAC
jgi:hypothetical protein